METLALRERKLKFGRERSRVPSRPPGKNFRFALHFFRFCEIIFGNV